MSTDNKFENKPNEMSIFMLTPKHNIIKTLSSDKIISLLRYKVIKTGANSRAKKLVINYLKNDDCYQIMFPYEINLSTFIAQSKGVEFMFNVEEIDPNLTTEDNVFLSNIYKSIMEDYELLSLTY